MVGSLTMRHECCQLLTRVGLRLGMLYPQSQQDQALQAVSIAAQGGAIVLPMSFDESEKQQFSRFAKRMVEDFGRIDMLILGIDAESRRTYGDMASVAEAIRPYLEKPRPRGQLILLGDQDDITNEDEELQELWQSRTGTARINRVAWNGPDTDFGLWKEEDD